MELVAQFRGIASKGKTLVKKMETATPRDGDRVSFSNTAWGKEVSTAIVDLRSTYNDAIRRAMGQSELGASWRSDALDGVGNLRWLEAKFASMTSLVESGTWEHARFPRSWTDLIRGVAEVADQAAERLSKGTTAADDAARSVGSGPYVPSAARDGIGRDLTYLEAHTPSAPIVGRDQEIDKLIDILSAPGKSSAIVLGEAGVGKTAVVRGLAQRIAAGDVPEALRGKHIVEWDTTRIEADGARWTGLFEKEARHDLQYIRANPDVIPFVDETHNLRGLGAHDQSDTDLLEILKPDLQEGRITMVGASTRGEWKGVTDKDASVARRFLGVPVAEPTPELTLSIVRSYANHAAKVRGVAIGDDARRASVELGERYMSNRSFPDKAIDLIDSAVERVLREQSGSPEIRAARSELRRLEVDRAAIAGDTSIAGRADLSKLEEDVAAKSKELDRLISKERAERAAIARLRATESALANADPAALEGARRAAALLAEVRAGSGLYHDRVDADAIAQAVERVTGVPASFASGDEAARFLTLEHDLGARVIGQPDAVSLVSDAIRRNRSGIGDPNRPIGSFLLTGRTGTGKTQLAKSTAAVLNGDERFLSRINMEAKTDGALLLEDIAEKVRKQPFGVLLLDEVEKAHPKALDVLLPALDEGYMIDRAGRRVDLRNLVVMMTTNVPHDALGTSFRPEMLNRFDEVVPFRALDRDGLESILDTQLQPLVGRLAARGLELDVTPSARTYLLDHGFDPDNGARPLKRSIQRNLENELARDMLRSDLQPGTRLTASIDEATGRIEIA